jgi:hypothetical protein
MVACELTSCPDPAHLEELAKQKLTQNGWYVITLITGQYLQGDYESILQGLLTEHIMPHLVL